MREDILDYLNDNQVPEFTVTDQLPWTKDGEALYLKNLKVLYVDQPQTIQEPLFDTLDGGFGGNENTTVSIYVTTDAKILPSNYEAMINTVKSGVIETGISGETQKVTNVTTEYTADELVTRFDYNFTKFICNN